MTTKRTREIQAPNFSNVVKTTSIGGALPEIQSVTVESTDGLMFGGFTLDFNSTGKPVYIRADESSDDFEYKWGGARYWGNFVDSEDTFWAQFLAHTVDRSEMIQKYFEYNQRWE